MSGKNPLQLPHPRIPQRAKTYNCQYKSHKSAGTNGVSHVAIREGNFCDTGPAYMCVPLVVLSAT
jgi:hypothetical protein